MFTTQCFVCSQRCCDTRSLCSATTQHSLTPYPQCLGQVLGEKFALVLELQDQICTTCCTILEERDKLYENIKQLEEKIMLYLKVKFMVLEDDVDSSVTHDTTRDVARSPREAGFNKIIVPRKSTSTLQQVSVRPRCESVELSDCVSDVDRGNVGQLSGKLELQEIKKTGSVAQKHVESSFKVVHYVPQSVSNERSQAIQLDGRLKSQEVQKTRSIALQESPVSRESPYKVVHYVSKSVNNNSLHVGQSNIRLESSEGQKIRNKVEEGAKTNEDGYNVVHYVSQSVSQSNAILESCNIKKTESGSQQEVEVTYKVNCYVPQSICNKRNNDPKYKSSDEVNTKDISQAALLCHKNQGISQAPPTSVKIPEISLENKILGKNECKIKAPSKLKPIPTVISSKTENNITSIKTPKITKQKLNSTTKNPLITIRTQRIITGQVMINPALDKKEKVIKNRNEPEAKTNVSCINASVPIQNQPMCIQNIGPLPSNLQDQVEPISTNLNHHNSVLRTLIAKNIPPLLQTQAPSINNNPQLSISPLKQPSVDKNQKPDTSKFRNIAPKPSSTVTLLYVPTPSVKAKSAYFSKLDVKFLEHHCTDNKCYVCDVKFDNFSSLLTHLRNNHVDVECLQCDVKMKHTRKYLSHLSYHQTSDITCLECGVLNCDVDSLKSHMESVHKFKFSCVTCGQQFRTKFCLFKHTYTHNRGIIPKYKCRKCKLRFKLKSDFNKHMKTHKKIRKVKIKKTEWICDICGKIFTLKNTLQSHMSVHTGVYKHRCDICNKGFNHIASFKIHLETHKERSEQTKKYTCKYCGKQFVHQGAYSVHRRWHENPYPAKCQYCGLMSRHLVVMREHIRRVHTKEKPFKCEICDKSFFTKRLLEDHKHSHGIYRLMCCERGFAKKLSYDKHRFEVHGIPIPEKKFVLGENRMVISNGPSSILPYKPVRGKKSVV